MPWEIFEPAKSIAEWTNGEAFLPIGAIVRVRWTNRDSGDFIERSILIGHVSNCGSGYFDHVHSLFWERDYPGAEEPVWDCVILGQNLDLVTKINDICDQGESRRGITKEGLEKLRRELDE